LAELICDQSYTWDGVRADLNFMQFLARKPATLRQPSGEQVRAPQFSAPADGRARMGRGRDRGIFLGFVLSN
jgi:hypothetical protein